MICQKDDILHNVSAIDVINIIAPFFSLGFVNYEMSASYQIYKAPSSHVSTIQFKEIHCSRNFQTSIAFTLFKTI